MTFEITPETSGIAEVVWEVTKHNGFFPFPDGEGRHIKAEFIAEFMDFVSKNFTHVPGVYLLRRLWVGFMTEAMDLKWYHNGEMVSLARINKLAVIWAAILLRYSYRGVTSDEKLNLIKDKVAALLARLDYPIPGALVLFGPVGNVWEEQEDCGRIRKVDVPPPVGELIYDGEVIRPIVPQVCKDCTARPY